VPKWCSSSCRHRAWELSRAAASGHAAIQIVDRVIEVDRPVTRLVEVTVSPRGARWPAALADLARQLDSGRVYDRDLPGLADALREVLAAARSLGAHGLVRLGLFVPTTFTGRERQRCRTLTSLFRFI